VSTGGTHVWKAKASRYSTRRKARQVCRRRRPLFHRRERDIEVLELSLLVQGQGRLPGPGFFKDVPLKQARLLRDAARLQVRAGVDLVQEKRFAREEA